MHHKLSQLDPATKPTLLRILVALWIVAGSLAQMRTVDAEDAPFGLERRVTWTTSRLVGSPEPPLPYTVEKSFTNLTFKSPLYVADEPGTAHLLVVLQGGEVDKPSQIRRFVNDPATNETELFLEVSRRMIYSVCFHPDYQRNGYVFVFTNGNTGDKERTNRVTRYTVQRQPPHKIEPGTEEIILEWRSAGHDGGDMAFGLDGMFYITTGDGTTDSDTWNSGQTMDDLLGNVLRIDLNRRTEQQPYAIPEDNPFVSMAGARPEIWAYGLRNPWRMSIDAKTGHVWVGNNGQDLWETAHLVGRGENYGWSVYEGSHPFYLGRKRGPTPHVKPTIEHHHSEFRSLTGGVVYYGDKFPELNGAYIYGDYASGRIWGMKHDVQRPLWHRELADSPLQIAAFRVDQRGELLVVDHGGGLYRMVSAPTNVQPAAFPKRLSETGLFASVPDQQPAAGLIPYSVNASGWADGARSDRWIAVPGEEQITYENRKSWSFPDGTALVQTLWLDREQGNSAPPLRVETRVLLRQQGEWAGYSYRWNAGQTDADLVPKEGADAELAVSNQTRTSWRFPSRMECMACHSRAANFVLGISESQLNRDHQYGSVRDNQLRALKHIGIFAKSKEKPPEELAKLADPYDVTADLEARARAYLHVQCSACHMEAGGGNAQMELPYYTSRDRMKLIGARPQHDTFGIENAMLVAPQDPARSVLIHRLSRRGPGQMPPLVSRQVDERAVELFREWIKQLKPDRPFVQEWRMEDFTALLDEVNGKRSFESGQSTYRDIGCVQCHRLGGEGGTVGPDLKGIAKRVQPREVLESILLPSKVIPDEYAGVVIQTEDGDVVSGRIEREDAQVIVVRPMSSSEAAREILIKNIAQRRRSDVSNMPGGIVNVLKREEVLDLMAYILSEGNAQDARFQ